MLVTGSLTQARQRLQEVLSDVVKRPEVAGDLADELSQVFYVLRNSAYFVEFQHKELGELCQEMDRL